MTNKPISPKQYIRTRARNLPLDTCYINHNWKENRMASIFVVRKHSNHNFTFGIYLVDLLALGTKDTFYHFNVNESVLNELLERSEPENWMKVPYPLVHNIIYGANDFAEYNGFKLHGDFELTQHILEMDTDEVEYIEIEFGKNGEPFLLL